MQTFDRIWHKVVKWREQFMVSSKIEASPLPPRKCEIPYVPFPQHWILKLLNLLLDLTM